MRVDKLGEKRGAEELEWIDLGPKGLSGLMWMRMEMFVEVEHHMKTAWIRMIGMFAMRIVKIGMRVVIEMMIGMFVTVMMEGVCWD